jgi:hypothetical protein
MSSGTFAAFSKFHLNTSKSTNTKVVQFVEGHNFHVDWISNFERKRVKNLVNWQYLLFTETWRHSMLASRFCKIRGEKHPRAFVKVVEGSEIYNFPIHHLMHFYSNFWSFRRSNRGAVSQGRAGRHRTAPRRNVAHRACAAPTSASEPPRAFPRPHASPRPRVHRGPRSPRMSRGALDLATIRALLCPPVCRRLPCESAPPECARRTAV